MEELVRSLLGEPNGHLSDFRTGDLRFGRRGSISVKVAPHPRAGVWYDFEAGVGGGIGTLAGHLGGARDLAVPVRLARFGTEARQRSDRVVGTGPVDFWARGQSLQSGVPVALGRWLCRRSLWRADVPLPQTLRWVPRGSGGTLVALAGSCDRWRVCWPRLPECGAVQRIPVGADGTGDGAKKSLGLMYGAVMVIGDPGPGHGSALVCEGVADGLALAARSVDTVVVVFGTSAMEGAVDNGLGEFLAGFGGGVTVWADRDQPSGGTGGRPRRGPAGERAAHRLRRAVIGAGGVCDVVQPGCGAKDVAELAAVAGFEPVDRARVLVELASLRSAGSGAPDWELWRQASVAASVKVE